MFLGNTKPKKLPSEICILNSNANDVMKTYTNINDEGKSSNGTTVKRKITQ